MVPTSPQKQLTVTARRRTLSNLKLTPMACSFFIELYETYLAGKSDAQSTQLSEFTEANLGSLRFCEAWPHPYQELWKLLVVFAIPQARTFINAWKEDNDLKAPGVPATEDLPTLAEFPLGEIEATPGQAIRIARYWSLLESQLDSSEQRLLMQTASGDQSVSISEEDQAEYWSRIDATLRSSVLDFKTRILMDFLPRLGRIIDNNMSPSLKQKEGADDVAHSVVRVVLQMEEDGKLAIDESESFWRLLITISIRRVRKKATRWTRGKRDIGMEINLSDETPLEELAEDAGDLTNADGAQASEFLRKLEGSLSADEKIVLQGKIQGLTGERIAEQLGKSRRQATRIWKAILEKISKLFEEGENADQ